MKSLKYNWPFNDVRLGGTDPLPRQNNFTIRPSIKLFCVLRSIPPFIHSLNNHFLNACYVLGITLGAGDTSVNTTDKVPAFMELTF